MPNCSRCGAETAHEGQVCSACESKQEHLPATQANQRAHTQTVEAEIIDDADTHGYASGQSAYGSGQEGPGGPHWRVHGRGFGRGWQQNGAFGQASRELSCLPALITLALGVSLGIQWGFLASLGFFFFYILGSALALGVSVRRTLMGKPVLVWFNRLLVWIFAYVVAYNLAI